MPLSTPYLRRFLSHANFSDSQIAGLESVVVNWFHSGHRSTQNCAAILGYQLEFERPADGVLVLRADPVFQQMDINHAVLADQSVLDLELFEAQEIVSTLNQHFESDGIKVELVSACRWYCHFPYKLDISTKSPGMAVGRDVAAESPTGPDAKKWRSTLAEIEMLLYSHPINLQRQRQGKVAVNSLWLWGEGAPVAAQALTDPAIPAHGAAVFANNFYTKSMANNCGLPVSDFSELAGWPLQDHSVLVVDDRLMQAAATADESLRVEALQQLEDQVFAPLWKKLGRRGFKSVQIWTGGNRWLQLDAVERFKFWRQIKPLNDFINDSAAESHVH